MKNNTYYYIAFVFFIVFIFCINLRLCIYFQGLMKYLMLKKIISNDHCFIPVTWFFYTFIKASSFFFKKNFFDSMFSFASISSISIDTYFLDKPLEQSFIFNKFTFSSSSGFRRPSFLYSIFSNLGFKMDSLNSFFKKKNFFNCFLFEKFFDIPASLSWFFF